MVALILGVIFFLKYLIYFDFQCLCYIRRQNNLTFAVIFDNLSNVCCVVNTWRVELGTNLHCSLKVAPYRNTSNTKVTKKRNKQLLTYFSPALHFMQKPVMFCRANQTTGFDTGMTCLKEETYKKYELFCLHILNHVTE